MTCKLGNTGIGLAGVTYGLGDSSGLSAPKSEMGADAAATDEDDEAGLDDDDAAFGDFFDGIDSMSLCFCGEAEDICDFPGSMTGFGAVAVSVAIAANSVDGGGCLDVRVQAVSLYI